MQLDQKVRDLMTSPAISVASDASVYEVIEKMNEKDIRHVPIVEEGMVVGMISDRDVRDYFGVQGSVGLPSATVLEYSDAQVSDVMHTDVLSVDEESDLREALELMTEYKIGAVPVVGSADQELVGMLSYIDVLKALLEDNA